MRDCIRRTWLNANKGIFLFFLILGFLSCGTNVAGTFNQEDMPGNQIDPVHLEIFDEIVQHLLRRDFSSALALFDTLPEEEVRSIPVRIMRASILNSAGRTADARRIAEGIIAEDSDNTDALMILADAAAIDGQDRDRRNFLNSVLAVNPNHTRALNDLGNIHIGSRNLRNAAGYFDRVLAYDPNNGDALIGRAAVHRLSREWQNAEQLLDHAISIHPTWAEPFHERARLYRTTGFFDDALEDLNTALLLEPDKYWAIIDQGLVLMDMDRRREALESFERAIALDPNIFMAYVFSAGLRDEFGDWARAEQEFITLARLRPDYFFAFESIGVIRMRNQDWAGAREAFLEAFRQAPTEFNYAILAALNWMRAGRPGDARPFLAQVLRTVPRDSLDHAMLRLLHDLRGDADVLARVESEQDLHERSRMLFYLATYYDITGSPMLANRLHLRVQELEAFANVEWQLNQIALEQRGLLPPSNRGTE